MYLSNSRYFLPLVAFASMLSTKAMAQNNVWVTEKFGSVKTKKDATKEKWKTYKEALANQGMDEHLNHAFLIGGRLNSDGWSGGAYLLSRKNQRSDSWLWQLHFSEIKHEKQTKRKGTNSTFKELGNPTQYVYGKVNNLYTLQLGVGKEKVLLPAVIEGNLSVGFRYTVGLSIAMLKPYYLKLIYTDNKTPETAHIEEHNYSRTDSAQFLNPTKILGAATWQNNLRETKFVPGVYAEAAFTLIPGKAKYLAQVITLGGNISVYNKTLFIVADQKAFPWQASLFASFALGKRW